jgi:tRNA(Ile)-lysidine synthetase-like protein
MIRDFVYYEMDFKTEWFANPQWWFTASEQDDKYLSTKFELLLGTDCDELTQILLFDQLSRHHYRNESANHIIQYFLQRALAISNRILCRSKTYSAIELSFILLPLRHAATWDGYIRALGYAWDFIKTTSDREEIAIIKRFLKASYSRGTAESLCPLVVSIPPPSANVTLNCDKYSHLLQNNSGGIAPLNWNVEFEEDLAAIDDDGGLYIVSLSGGVDSMITSFILRKKVASVVAVHINYKNKASCDQEAEFIKHWCDVIGMPLYIREINEIQRAPCMKHEMRSCYEDYTRRVRYSTYKRVAEMLGCSENYAVVMGHNRDDAFENILTNIAYGQKHDDLTGMESSSRVDGILFLRPLLKISKHDIRVFAREAHIPHLHDSTPSWSQRGKIRDIVRPALSEWDPRILDGLFALAKSVKEMTMMQNEWVDAIVAKTRFQDGVWHCEEFPRNASLTFWKAYFDRILGTPVVSNKCLAIFCEKLSKFDVFKMPLRKDIIIRVDNTSIHVEQCL